MITIDDNKYMVKDRRINTYCMHTACERGEWIKRVRCKDCEKWKNGCRIRQIRKAGSIFEEV